MLIRTFTSSAIYINQADLPERAPQVKIMCDVYRFAKKVLIYLGEDSDGLDRAVDLLNMIHEKAQEPISRVWESTKLPHKCEWSCLLHMLKFGTASMISSIVHGLAECG